MTRDRIVGERAILLGGDDGESVLGRASAESARQVLRVARRYGIPIEIDTPRVAQLLTRGKSESAIGEKFRPRTIASAAWFPPARARIAVPQKTAGCLPNAWRKRRP